MQVFKVLHKALVLEPGPLVLKHGIWRILHRSSNPFQLFHVSDHRDENKRRTPEVQNKEIWRRERDKREKERYLMRRKKEKDMGKK